MYQLQIDVNLCKNENKNVIILFFTSHDVQNSGDIV